MKSAQGNEGFRLSPLKVGHQNTRNRIVVPPMASQTADENGFVSSKTLEHYSHLAQSGAGIVMVEYTYVHIQGKSEENQLAADNDNKVSGLKKLAQEINKNKTLSFLQLTHSLAKSESQLTGGELLGASPIAVPVKDRLMEIPRAMSLQEINRLRDSFVAAAHRAFEAGFHGIELHSAHGYGLNQMLSPLTNQRRDLYGGTLENRARLLLEIVMHIKIKIPTLLISVRVPGQDFIPGGLSLEDMKWVVKKLEEHGVNLIHVSSGLGGWRRPDGRRGEGYLVEDASVLQQVTSLPVIGVGGIESAAYIEESLRLKKFSLAAVGRAILKNPKEFSKNVLLS